MQEIWAALATPNLHTLHCQLGLQEKLTGDTIGHYELWVERGIQRAKRCVKFMTVEFPEKVIAGQELLRQALNIMKYSGPVPLLSGEEMWQARPQKAPSEGVDNAYDPLLNHDEISSMQDKGKLVKASEWEDLSDACIKYVKNHPVKVDGVRLLDLEHLQSTNLEGLEVYLHRIVKVQGQVCITSADYTRQRKSQSYRVLCKFAGRGGGSYQ